jgi:hypothetical protein
MQSFINITTSKKIRTYKWIQNKKEYFVKVKPFSMLREFYIGWLMNKIVPKYCPKVFDHFEMNGEYYIVTEWVDAKPLGDCSPLDLVMNIPVDFTHYDLHKGNYLIDSKGQVKIIDFGQSYLNIKQAEEYIKSPNEIEGGYKIETLWGKSQEFWDSQVEISLGRMKAGRISSIHDPYHDVIEVCKRINPDFFNANAEQLGYICDTSSNFKFYVNYETKGIPTKSTECLFDMNITQESEASILNNIEQVLNTHDIKTKYNLYEIDGKQVKTCSQQCLNCSRMVKLGRKIKLLGNKTGIESPLSSHTSQEYQCMKDRITDKLTPKAVKDLIPHVTQYYIRKKQLQLSEPQVQKTRKVLNKFFKLEGYKYRV